MPIKDKSKYPDNWKELRESVLKRADNKCEQCGVPNYSVGARDLQGVWHDEDKIESMNSTTGYALFGQLAYPKYIKIVLTISHQDHNTYHNDLGNLKALCQKCHNRHDSEYRKKNAAITRRLKRKAHNESIGQGEFELW